MGSRGISHDKPGGRSAKPNLHHSKSPYETIQQFLHRVYGPIVEAASRTVELQPQAMIHMFTDISLMGKSAVLSRLLPRTEPTTSVIIA